MRPHEHVDGVDLHAAEASDDRTQRATRHARTLRDAETLRSEGHVTRVAE
jgi:hypothetical protein